MSSVILSNVPATTSSERVKELVQFCGKIDTIDKIDDSSYKVVFAAPEALETALLLNGVILDGNPISVSKDPADTTAVPGAPATQNRDVPDSVATTVMPKESNGPHPSTTSSIDPEATTVALASQVPLENTSKPSPSMSSSPEPTPNAPIKDIEQEYKPKAAIFAEYLSQGYVLGDQALQKAIQFDSQKGYSSKFKSFLTNLDTKYHVQEKFAQEKSRAITSAGNAHLFEKKSKLDSTLDKYFAKAKSTTYGSKLHDFYLKGVSDVRDIHVEAKRLAEIKKSKAASPSASPSPAP